MQFYFPVSVLYHLWASEFGNHFTHEKNSTFFAPSFTHNLARNPLTSRNYCNRHLCHLVTHLAIRYAPHFFGDIAHDLFTAKNSLHSHSVPLLGIASSVPRFHQGPVAIWIEMIGLLLFGQNTILIGYMFALISIAAVILVYELVTVAYRKRPAHYAALLLAFSPLAVAQGRMIYHTNPIPLFITLYLFALIRLWHKKKYALFWAVLAFCLTFQFELAQTPLVLLIPYVMWRHHMKFHPRMFKEIVPAVIIGLFPQLLYDLTHRFTHLGGFLIWIVYRSVAFFGYRHDHTFSFAQLKDTFSIFTLYFTRIWSTDNLWVALPCACLFIASFLLIGIAYWQKRRLPILIELTALASILLSLAYIVLATPSEAYFPPFLVFTAILIGFVCEQISQHLQYGKYLVIVALALYAGINTLGILQHNFFVSNPQAFSYSYSFGEQQEIMNTVVQLSHNDFHLLTTRDEGKFPSFFDNMRWIADEWGITEDTSKGQIFFVESKDSLLKNQPNITRYIFPSADVYFQ